MTAILIARTEMTEKNENQNQTGPVKMYRPWVGVVLSLLISGAAQFLAGKRRQGIVWFLILLILPLICFWCMAVLPGDVPGFAAWAVTLFLWLVMLVKSYRPVPRFRWFGWLFFILLAWFLEEAAFDGGHLFFRPFKVPTGSMSPTIQGNQTFSNGTKVSGDRIIAVECAYWFSKPKRGDIVVFNVEGIPEGQRDQFAIPRGEFYVKRVVGVPGDDLSVWNGHLYNHGQIVTQPPVLARMEFADLKLPSQVYLKSPADDYKVPDGSYFVVGDNTGNSLDSRFFGPIKGEDITARVNKIYWPLNRAGKVE